MKNYMYLSMYVVVLALATYSNIALTRLDSVLTEPVLNKNNEFVVAQEEAKNADVILSTDVLFRITVKDLSDKSLMFVVDFSKQLKTEFENRGIEVNIASLATITNYSLDPIDNFLSEKVIKNLDREKWLKDVLSHEYMHNTFIGRDGDDYLFFISVMPTDQNVSELVLYEAAFEIMHENDFNIIDMYFGYSMHKLGFASESVETDFGEDISIVVFGWPIWRTLINKETFSFIFSVLIVGSLLPAIAMWIILGSFRQMLIALFCNASILWVMRGLIGLIDLKTSFSFHEETYTILAYVPVMMLNYSFFMRHFKEYNAIAHFFVEKKMFTERFVNRQFFWQKVLNQTTLKVSVYFVVVVTCVEFLIFMLLPHTNGARSMLTVAVLAIVAIVLCTIPMVRVILPVLHSIIGGLGSKPVQLEASFFARLIVKFSVKKYSCFISTIIVMSLIIVTIKLYSKDLLLTESNPGAFVRATPAGVVIDSLEKEGQPGSGTYKILVKGQDLYNSGHIENIATFVSNMRNSGAVGSIVSPTDFLGDVLYRDFYDLCDNPNNCMKKSSLRKISNEFEISEEDLLTEEWSAVIKDKASKYFVSMDDHSIIINATGLASKTQDMRTIRDLIVQLGSEIGAIGADKIAQYPETDDLITVGALGNYMGSPALIGVISIILFLMIERVNTISRSNPFVAGCVVVIPFVVSTTITLIVMMAFGIYLDIATAAIGNITVSAAADLPVFLTLRFRQVIAEQGWDFEKNLISDDMVDEITRAGADVFVNALTYLPLAIPYLVAFKPILNLGVMLLIALAGCYVGTLISLPFLRWCGSSK